MPPFVKDPVQSTPVVQMDDVSVRWGRNTVLSDVDLTLNAGERLAVVGP